MIELNSIIQRPNIPQIKVFNKILGELTTVSSKQSPHTFQTELKNRFGKTLGSELFILEGNNKATGSYISVGPEYRNKNYRFGEILRLSSIIMILENKIQEFKICSKNSAIFFHSKYKFEPAITKTEEKNKILESIIKNCEKDFEEIKIEAKNLYEESTLNTDETIQKELCEKTNVLVKKYIQKILEIKGEYKRHPFKSSLDMILTDRIIRENKDFFNNLFQKHNIDYKI